jgi:hypothetical protein
MHVPIRQISYYTGGAAENFGYKNVTVDLNNAVLNDEMMLLIPSWWTIDQSPYTLAQSYAELDMIDNDGEVSVFVSYRTDESEEPNSRYDFKMGLSSTQLGDIQFDVSAMRQRNTVRQWQSSQELRNSDTPYLIARHKGIYLLTGESVSLGDSGTLGIPDDFPAETWYLVSGSIVLPEIVRAFNALDTGPIHMEPLAGYVDGDTMQLNTSERIFSVSAPGLGDVDYGLLILSNTSMSWEIHFPGAALTRTGDNLTILLPALPTQATLPDFDSAILYVYRLDEGAVAFNMVQHLLDRRGNPMPSYAMESGFNNGL